MRFRLVAATFVWLSTSVSVQAIQLPKTAAPALVPEAETLTAPATVNAMMVFGEDKFKMKSQKTVRDLTKDIHDPVLDLLEQPAPSALAFSPDEKVLQQTLGKNARLHSERVLKPAFLNSLAGPPFIKTDLGPERAEISGWDFSVRTSAGGSPVFQRRGDSRDLPATITWDGRNQQGFCILEPGIKYSWEFFGKNQSGRRISVRQGTFFLAAFRFFSGREQSVVMSGGSVFKPDSAIELSPLGKKWLGETADDFRESGAEKLEMFIYDKTLASATERGRILARYLAELLMLEPERLPVQPRLTSKSGAARVEVRFTRNR